MTPAEVKAIRQRAGLTLDGLTRLLRISDKRTVQRWERGDVLVTGPASIVLDMLDKGELPERFKA